MSDHRSHRRNPSSDAGLTLPELLIVVSVIGIILTVVGSVVVVSLRSAGDVEGKINLAADEQSLQYDMPTDLASAAIVDTDPSLTPCGAACPADVVLGGSNVMLLSWSSERWVDGSAIEADTNVSYYFRPTPDTDEYQIDRIECTSTEGGAWSCTSRVVLASLPGPPGGGKFIPGDTEPRWVMQVSEPLSPDAIADDDFADSTTRKDAQRVVVTINGRGGADGLGGGSRQVSITAGGVLRGELEVNATDNAPTFYELPGDCGGPITLIVDNSELLTKRWHHHHHHNPTIDHGDAKEAFPGYKLKDDPPHDEPDRVANVRRGLREFIDALAGTPSQLQIVTFSDESHVLDPTGGNGWTHYVDLTDRDEVDALLDLIDDPTTITASGGANYEDGWFRAFYDPTGTLQEDIPDLTVFVQAEFPTVDRLRSRATPGVIIEGSPALPPPGWPTYNPEGEFDENGTYFSNGTDYSQIAFDRADWIADQVRARTRIVGVGAGDGLLDWLGDPGAPYDYQYERGARQYQMADQEYQEAKYEKLDKKGKWKKSSQSEYEDNNGDENPNFRIRWKSIKKKDYDKKNDASLDDSDPEADGYRFAYTDDWEWISEELYQANNDADFDDSDPEADGFRDAGREWVNRDSDAMEWYPTETESTAGGYRYHKVYTPDGQYADPPSWSWVMTRTLLSRLVTGGDQAVEGTWDGASAQGANASENGAYTNGDVAEIYVPERHWPFHDHDDDWDRVPFAMRTIAMSECGGSVTMSATLPGDVRPDAYFVFQATEFTDNDGNSLETEPVYVATDPIYPARAIEFDPPTDDHHWVTIFPSEKDYLITQYDVAATPWTCWGGIDELGPDAMETVPGESWPGVRVRIANDVAVSCQLNLVETGS